MLYLNQLDYKDMPYEHNLKHGGAGAERSNVSSAGCGLCCMCMVVENMTIHKFPLLDCRDLSHEIHANMSGGTDLRILGPKAASKFGLEYSETDDIDKLCDHLMRGGMAIANAGGDRDGYTGLLSHGGHYVLALSVRDGMICLLDPSYTDKKYREEGREGRLKEDYPFLYIPVKALQTECENRSPSYYLFQRPMPENIS